MLKKEELVKYGEISKIIMFFQEIDMIPRESGNLKGIVEYLEKFAVERGLEHYIDEFNNVIIKKSATNGKNNYIAFQSHTDMVCEKISESTHDFTKDPVQLVIQDDHIQSNETSIGADNGIGVAFMLSMLDSNDLIHPNLEMIFTADEETSMIGAKKIDFSKIKSNRIISFDSFSDDIITCGCASNTARDINNNIARKYIADIQNAPSYSIKISGFERWSFRERYRKK